jgi:hypothetical protein
MRHAAPPAHLLLAQTVRLLLLRLLLQRSRLGLCTGKWAKLSRGRHGAHLMKADAAAIEADELRIMGAVQGGAV